MAYAFLCAIEEKQEREDKLPEFYKKYVDDIFAMMPNVPAATAFLSTLNDCHPFIHFTMEIEKRGCHLTTGVYRKPADSRLLLHYQSHVDQRYKRCLQGLCSTGRTAFRHL